MGLKLKKGFFAFAGQRLVCVLCAAAVFIGLFGFLPGGKAAGAVPEASEIWEGEGIIGSPFLIDAAFQLDAVRYYPDAEYKLTGDIDLSAYSDFIPIGSEGRPFTGILDGAGFSVSCFEVKEQIAAGLFGYIKNASILNITVRDSFVSGTEYAGGIAGRAENSEIINCRNINTSVSGGGAYAGGIAGDLSGRIEYSSNSGSVNGGEDSHTGGIAGRINGQMQYCYNIGGIYSLSGTGGGLAGTAEASAFSCFNSGPVSAGKGAAGGIFGTASGEASACYNTGQISGAAAAGGIFGIAGPESGVRYAYNSGTIIENAAGLYGAVTGQDKSAEYTAVYYLNSAVFAIGGDGYSANIKPVTFANLSSANVFSQFLTGINPFPGSPYFVKPSRTVEGCASVCFPELAMFYTAQYTHGFEQPDVQNYDNQNSKRASLYTSHCEGHENESPFTAGSGTEESPFLIQNAAQLSHLRSHPGSYFKLAGNINLSGFTYKNDTAAEYGWIPIGTQAVPFTGSFDGSGYIISGLSLSRPVEYAGLFGYTRSASVKNLGIYGCEVFAGESASAGILAGSSEGGTFTGCFAIGDIICRGAGAAGGIAGTLSGTVTDCFTKINISGSCETSGGITGLNSGVLSKSFAAAGSAELEGGVFGGLAGQNSGSISRVYSAFTDAPGAYLFGAAAGNNTGEITDSYCFAGVPGAGEGADTVTPADISEFTAPGELSGIIPGLNSNPSHPDFVNTGENASGCRTEYLPALASAEKGSWIWQKISRECTVYSKCEAGENESRLENGRGTAAEPYEISSPGQLNHIRRHLSACFILTADIDLQGFTLSPAGDETAPFNGCFDGAGYRILNPGAPLFGVIGETGCIKNTGFEGGINSSGNEYTGMIAGINRGIITACFVKGMLSAGTGGNTGGIAGKNTGTISHCLFSGRLNAQSDRTGGIAGVNFGEIHTCHSAGELSGGENTVLGGIAGESSGNIKYCLNTSKITGPSENTGAVAGISEGSVFDTLYSSECGASGEGTSLSAGELTDSAVLAVFGGFAIGGWQKRAAEDEKVYYPEITALAVLNSIFEAVSKSSSEGVRRELTRITPVPAEITYGQSLSECELSGGAFYSEINIPGVFSWNVPNPGLITPENGDSFDVLFTPEYELYKSCTARNVVLNVNPADPVPPTPGVIKYDPEKTLSDIPLEPGWEWENPNIVPRVNNTGYYASYTPQNANYKPKSGVLLSVTIQPGEAKKPVLDSLVYDPGRKLSDIELPEGWSWDIPGTVPGAEQDKYPASFTDPDGNYSPEESVLITLKIIPLTPELPQLEPVTYREGLKLEDIELPEGWSWKAPETRVYVKNSGFIISFDAKGDPNKAGIDGAVIIITVIPAVPETPELTSVVYHSGVKLKNIFLPDGWSFRDGELCPTVKNDGYRLIYTPDEDGNYAPAEVTVPLTVEPAMYNGAIPAIRSIDYKSGVTLADLELLPGWSWENPGLPLITGNNAYKAVFEDPEGNYLPFSADVYVRVGDFLIKNIKSKYTLSPGDTLELIPDPAGGQWSYDKKLLSLETAAHAVFTALAAGSTEIKYSIGGKEFTASVEIKAGVPNQGLPRENDVGGVPLNPDTGRRIFPLLTAAGICGIAVILLRKRLDCLSD